MNHLMMQFPNHTLPYQAIGICFLLFWGLIGFMTYRSEAREFTSLLLVNLPACLVLLLQLFQEMILGQYWEGLLGLATQFYSLPILSISFTLTFWAHQVWAAYMIGFLLMIITYSVGWQLRKKMAG